MTGKHAPLGHYLSRTKKPSKKGKKVLPHLKVNNEPQRNYYHSHFRQKPKSNCRVQSTLYFLQGSSLRFHNINSYVQYSENANGCKPQIHGADPKLVYNAQEIKTDEKIRDLLPKKTNHSKHFPIMNGMD